MNKNNSTADIGMVLVFDETSFNRAMATGRRHLLAPLEKVRVAYNNLGLPEPFTQEVLQEIFQTGLDSITERLAEITRKDLQGFRSQVVIDEMLGRVADYMQPLRSAVDETRKALAACTNECGYQFRVDAFQFADGQVTIDQNEAKEAFIVRLQSDKQLKALEKLKGLEAAYNETIGYIRTLNLPLSGSPWASAPLMNTFFNRRQNSKEGPLAELEVNNGFIAYIR